jgi:hypothetical protein
MQTALKWGQFLTIEKITPKSALLSLTILYLKWIWSSVIMAVQGNSGKI